MKFNIDNNHLIIGIFFLSLIYIFDCQKNQDIRDNVRKNKKIKKLKNFNELNKNAINAIYEYI